MASEPTPTVDGLMELVDALTDEAHSNGFEHGASHSYTNDRRSELPMEAAIRAYAERLAAPAAPAGEPVAEMIVNGDEFDMGLINPLNAKLPQGRTLLYAHPPAGEQTAPAGQQPQPVAWRYKSLPNGVFWQYTEHDPERQGMSRVLNVWEPLYGAALAAHPPAPAQPQLDAMPRNEMLAFDAWVPTDPVAWAHHDDSRALALMQHGWQARSYVAAAPAPQERDVRMAAVLPRLSIYESALVNAYDECGNPTEVSCALADLRELRAALSPADGGPK